MKLKFALFQACLLFFLVNNLAFAQTYSDSIYTNSLKIGVDIAKFGETFISNSKFRGVEVFAAYNINKHIYVAEYGTQSRFREYSNFNETTSGHYFRLGYDRNIISKGADWFHLGGRLSFSTFKHQAKDIELANPPFPLAQQNGPELNSFVMWLEAVVGIKVAVYGPVGMGFNLRLQRMLINNYEEAFKPSSAPGYGRLSQVLSPAFNYYIFIDLPHKTFYHIPTSKNKK